MRRSIRILTVLLSFVIVPTVFVFADTTETFTITDLSGPLVGNSYNGSFTYDSGGNVLSFTTDFPTWNDSFFPRCPLLWLSRSRWCFSGHSRYWDGHVL